MKTIGVLALQGAVLEHRKHIEKAGCRAVSVKTAADIEKADALILPGGESTAISRLIENNALANPIKTFARTKPIMGTCAGLILCASTLATPNALVNPLGLIDCCVARNGFGRQVDSFETALTVDGVGKDVPAVFIRAPYIENVGENVRVMARYEGKIVMAENEKVVVCAFHPELTQYSGIMDYFVSKIQE